MLGFSKKNQSDVDVEERSLAMVPESPFVLCPLLRSSEFVSDHDIKPQKND
jgi:hypothetical protein